MREQTFGDFVAECEMYQFSEERFNIMKEMSEFKLMEQYIENQKYIKENYTFIESVVLKDGYLSESTDSLSLIELTESANKKGESIWKKLINGIVKIWKTFVRFLKKIMNVFDKVNRQAIKARLIIKKLDVDDKVFIKLENIVKTAYSKSFPFVAFPNQPFLKKIKINYVGNTNNDVNKLKNDLAAALSTSYAYASLLENKKSGNTIFPVPVDDINSASKQYFKKKAKNLKNAIDILANSFSNSSINGMEIDVNNYRLEKIVDNLQKLSEKIGKEFSSFYTNDSTNSNLPAVRSSHSVAKQSSTNKPLSGEVIDNVNIDNSRALNSTNIPGNGGDITGTARTIDSKVISNEDKKMLKESYDEELEDEYFDEGVEEYDGGNLEMASKFLDTLTKCIGDTITMYTAYNKYRKFVIEGILKFDMEESGKELPSGDKPKELPPGSDPKYLPPEGSKAKVSGKETPRISGGRGHVVDEDEIANELKRRERNKVRV